MLSNSTLHKQKEGEFNSIADTNLYLSPNRNSSDQKSIEESLYLPVWLTAVTPADDEFRRNVQDLSDYREIGTVAWSAATGEGKISVRSQETSKPAERSQQQDLRKPAPSQRAIAYSRIAQSIFDSTTTEDLIQDGPISLKSFALNPLPQSALNLSPLPRQEANYFEVSAEDEVIMSEEAANHCLILFADSDIPVGLPVPRNVDEFRKGGARAGSKRNRQNEEIVESLQYIGSTEGRSSSRDSSAAGLRQSKPTTVTA